MTHQQEVAQAFQQPNSLQEIEFMKLVIVERILVSHDEPELRLDAEAVKHLYGVVSFAMVVAIPTAQLGVKSSGPHRVRHGRATF